MTVEIGDGKLRVVDRGRVQEVDLLTGNVYSSNHAGEGLQVIVKDPALGIAVQGICQLREGDTLVSIIAPVVATRPVGFSRN